ncbi:MAG: ABC transporter ATP-binding protein/permease [Lachnospiraceae bacterium]|jgi:ABC-type bacteriocin/lantibiotic exporter with double-glycine peptidase domain|nr:ABC transporter ATP-binding protein/permease [Lachnospiraceae bacterium]
MKHNRQMRKDCAYYMRGVIVADFFAQWMQILLPTINAFLIGEMADYLISLDSVGILNRLPGFVLAMIMTIIVVPIFVMLEYIYMNKQGFKYDAYMMERFIKKPLRDIEKTDSGEVIERLSGDLGDYNWNTVYIYDIPIVMITYFVVAVFLFIKHKIPIMYVCFIILLPAIKVFKASFLAGKKARYARETAEYEEARRTSENNVFISKDFVKNNNLIKLLMKYYESTFFKYWDKTGRRKSSFIGRNEGYDFIIKQIIPLIITLLGSYFAYKRYMSVGMIFTATLVLPMIDQWYSYAENYINQVKAAPEYEERLMLFYGDMEDKSRNTADTDNISELKGDNLSFAYDESVGPVIVNQSCIITKGRINHIKGANGTGKSTLMALMAGLYEPDTGTIKGDNDKSLTIRDLRKFVSLLEQDGSIFSGTIGDNLFVNNEKESQVKELFELLHMDKELDYVVEPGGTNLSPGERKKILIVRAILKDSDFYIFDEPYNHLDDKGKAGFMKAIEGIDKGIAIVSHQ